jgi:hypothetical protein
MDYQSALRDVSALAGGALMAYGAWLCYHPLGFIVGGGCLLTVSVLGTISSARRTRQ